MISKGGDLNGSFHSFFTNGGIMGHKTVYVFHPNRGESDGKIPAQVQNVLARFLHENENETFWFNCFGTWRSRFRRSDQSDFAAFLLEEKFIEVPQNLFDELGDQDALLKLNACDVAGFFIRDTETGQPKSVWQLLNPNGRIDRIYTDESDLIRPLRTKSGHEVQSCLVAQLD